MITEIAAYSTHKPVFFKENKPFSCLQITPCQLQMVPGILLNVQNVFLWTVNGVQTCPYQPLSHLF